MEATGRGFSAKVISQFPNRYLKICIFIHHGEKGDKTGD